MGQRPFKLSSRWVDHSPDLAPCVRGAPAIEADASCPCMITVDHDHCGGCGRVLVRYGEGGRHAPPIAEYLISFSKGTCRRLR